jgi:hypothetical protein
VKVLQQAGNQLVLLAVGPSKQCQTRAQPCVTYGGPHLLHSGGPAGKQVIGVLVNIHETTARHKRRGSRAQKHE